VPAELAEPAERAGFSAGLVDAIGENRVDFKLLGTVMLSLAWRRIWLDFGLTPPASIPRIGHCRHAAQRIAGRIIPPPSPQRCTKKSALFDGSYDRFRVVSSTFHRAQFLSGNRGGDAKAIRRHALRRQSGPSAEPTHSQRISNAFPTHCKIWQP
jgi:hypothetical protein